MDEVLSQGLLENFSRSFSDDLSQSLSVEVSPEESNLDGFDEECGVFGIVGHPEAANMTYLGLHALQHRGQESGGIVTTDGQALYAHRAMGLVAGRLRRRTSSPSSRGRVAIGHIRYSTTRSTTSRIASRCGRVRAAACGRAQRQPVERRGISRGLEAGARSFKPRSDSEVVIHLVAASRAHAGRARRRRAGAGQRRLFAAVSHRARVIAVRDPLGFRPLVLGNLKDAPSWPPRPARSTWSAPSTSATSSPARS